VQLVAQRDANRLELPRAGRGPLREGAQQLDKAEEGLAAAPTQLLPEICAQKRPVVGTRGASVMGKYTALLSGIHADAHMHVVCTSAQRSQHASQLLLCG